MSLERVDTMIFGMYAEADNKSFVWPLVTTSMALSIKFPKNSCTDARNPTSQRVDPIFRRHGMFLASKASFFLFYSKLSMLPQAPESLCFFRVVVTNLCHTLQHFSRIRFVLADFQEYRLTVPLLFDNSEERLSRLVHIRCSLDDECAKNQIAANGVYIGIDFKELNECSDIGGYLIGINNNR